MASICTKTQKLNTGASIPSIALGCWQASPEDTYTSVLAALKAGYRHIDTAHVYCNEADVGRAIKDSGVPRESLFITTKLWNTNHRDPLSALNGSLERLGMDYVDLYLVHWPVPFVKPPPDAEEQLFPKDPNNPGKPALDKDWDFVKTWELMQQLPKEKARAVGVSNMSKTNLEKLLSAPTTKVVPAANQVEMHPYYPRHQLLEYCKQKGIVVEAYSPLGSTGSPLLKDEDIIALAEKKGISPACLVISWALHRDTVVLPKSVTPSRIEANIKVVDLDDETADAISALYKTKGRRILNPDWGVPLHVAEVVLLCPAPHLFAVQQERDDEQERAEVDDGQHDVCADRAERVDQRRAGKRENAADHVVDERHAQHALQHHFRVRVHEVAHGDVAGRGEAEADEAQSDGVCDLPAPELVCADAEEQQPQRRDDGAREQEPEPELGLLDAAVALGFPDHKPVREVARVQTPDQGADDARQIHQRNAGVGVVPRRVVVQVVLCGEVEREKRVLQPPKQPRQQHGREPEHAQHEHEPLQVLLGAKPDKRRRRRDQLHALPVRQPRLARARAVHAGDLDHVGAVARVRVGSFVVHFFALLSRVDLPYVALSVEVRLVLRQEHHRQQHARDDHGDPADPPERGVLDHEAGYERPQVGSDRGSQDVDGQHSAELVRKVHIRQRELHLGLCAGLRRANKQLRPDGVAGCLGQGKPHRADEAEQYADDVADFAAVERRGRPENHGGEPDGREEHAGAGVHRVVRDAVQLVQRVLRRAGVVRRGRREPGDERQKRELVRLGPEPPVERVVGRVRRLWMQDDAVLGGLDCARLVHHSDLAAVQLVD